MKLIASDLDGTLLNEDGIVSEENAQAIKKAIDQGIKFVVATGRSYEAASKPLQAVGITSPIISLNGAVSYGEDQKIISKVAMDKEVSRQILASCQKRDMYIEFFTNDGMYSGSREYFLQVLVDIMKSANPDISDEEVREKAALRFQSEPVTFINDYEEIFSIDNVEIYKILAFSHDKTKLAAVREELSEESGIAITSSGDINLEFNHPEAQKGIALKSFAASLGIEMKDVMALGDNWNDASMLKMAGRGVAMANAEEGIKELCEYSTKSNIEDGVAAAIEEMLQEAMV
ncbi:Cof-type HAD-IIB family hydrolase [Oceanobacillus sp. 143]|jgi:Cof subfamily protein (haloacid dehalogenase superfamily)|uniref:Cof-type HAD-IIB family hydrolase n=1 Tax=Oceanobacillus zhaokaii TaxID=2052660 RepID=A0A345PLD2_9BACI|nr:Cof-type HAD-IIB family hydrolase [Oceanobacillus zhaokaii]AXI10812.1 Cof-type HAD-IIB family hydrolase [Oceanobacillus zhaokaii]QGS69705.1 Cof-type HAD-IIB family hydrolase [Oceanobacillus sp. 143]